MTNGLLIAVRQEIQRVSIRQGIVPCLIPFPVIIIGVVSAASHFVPGITAQAQEEVHTVATSSSYSVPANKDDGSEVELEQRQSAENLKKLALALAAYHGEYDRFPPHALVSKDGKKLLSWRVLVLPFLEEAALYKAFHLDEPWDSPHNKSLLPKMPRVFAPVRGQDRNKFVTFYQAFVGPGAAFEGTRSLRLRDFTDGTVYTVVLAEAATAVPWTRPSDLDYDPEKPLPRLGGLFPSTFLCATLDGTVHVFKKDFDKDKMRKVITRNGGEIVEDLSGLEADLPAGKDKKPDKPLPKKARGKFSISKETTYVTGPLDEAGYIDYATALNERLRQGVTPENNANVLLWQAFGPHPDHTKVPAAFFKWLGMETPPEDGDYFITPEEYTGEHLKLDASEEREEFLNQVERAARRPWAPRDYPKVAFWLKANEKPLALVANASKRSRYFLPWVPARSEKGSEGLIGTGLPGVEACHQCATALIARAMLHISQQRPDEAWQDLLICHRLGRLVGSGASLIEWMAGVRITNDASRADLVFLDRTKPNAKRIANCLRDLQELAPCPGLAEKLRLLERFWFLESVMMVDRRGLEYLEGLSGGTKKSVTALDDRILEGINWDPALVNGNRWFDRLVSAVSEKDRPTRTKKLEQIDADFKNLRQAAADPRLGLTKVFFGNGEARGKELGDILICLMTPACTKVQIAFDHAQQVRDNLLLAFTLAWYHSDRGHYPKELNELVPGYLGRLPGDIFSGKPLIYRPSRSGYLLYSVGANGADDNGRGRNDNPPGDDIGIRMPLPKQDEK
jgi:hypothetical protein